MHISKNWNHSIQAIQLQNRKILFVCDPPHSGQKKKLQMSLAMRESVETLGESRTLSSKRDQSNLLCQVKWVNQISKDCSQARELWISTSFSMGSVQIALISVAWMSPVLDKSHQKSAKVRKCRLKWPILGPTWADFSRGPLRKSWIFQGKNARVTNPNLKLFVSFSLWDEIGGFRQLDNFLFAHSGQKISTDTPQTMSHFVRFLWLYASTNCLRFFDYGFIFVHLKSKNCLRR
jgi:hypothetical protein